MFFRKNSYRVQVLDRSTIKYTEKNLKVYLDGDMLIGGFAIFPDSPDSWRRVRRFGIGNNNISPSELLSTEDKDRILKNIRTYFEKRKKKVEFVSEMSRSELLEQVNMLREENKKIREGLGK